MNRIQPVFVVTVVKPSQVTTFAFNLRHPCAGGDDGEDYLFSDTVWRERAQSQPPLPLFERLF